MPKHENVIKNFVNVELFHKEDSKKEDCLGWITIMEKAGEDLRKVLKEEKTISKTVCTELYYKRPNSKQVI